MNNKFFPPPPLSHPNQWIPFDTLDSIEFEDKKFYLSAEFEGKGSRGSLPDEISRLGGFYKEGKKGNYPKGKGLHSSDYLIIGNKGYQGNDGENCRKIIKRNKTNPQNKIPIIQQSHFEDLMNKYENRPRNN